MLWVDKYRPHTLDQMTTVNTDIAQHLKRLVQDGDCPHLLFYGVGGAGKKTLALAVLREIFGAAVEKVKVEGKTWKLEQGERKIEVELTTMSSNYHVEMNPSDVGTKDRYVVQEVIKDMAKSRPIDAAGQQGYKVLLLNEVDRLSKEAQHGLRRTMEKYSSACRLILICTSVSKVLDAVRSRCLPVRVAAPSVETVEKLVMDVAQKEKLAMPPELAARLALHYSPSSSPNSHIFTLSFLLKARMKHALHGGNDDNDRNDPPYSLSNALGVLSTSETLALLPSTKDMVEAFKAAGSNTMISFPMDTDCKPSYLNESSQFAAICKHRKMTCIVNSNIWDSQSIELPSGITLHVAMPVFFIVSSSITCFL